MTYTRCQRSSRDSMTAPRESSSWPAPEVIDIYKGAVFPTEGVNYHHMYLLDTLTKYFTIVLTCIKMSPPTQPTKSALLGYLFYIYTHDHFHTFPC